MTLRKNARFWSLVGWCAVIASTPNAAQAQSILQLSGTDWRIHDDADGKGVDRGLATTEASGPGWIPAIVPGNIQADLEAARLLRPISYGLGDPDFRTVTHKDWWYRKDVEIPATFAGKRLTLVFDGVDQRCTVWVNGQEIGGNVGMFKRFWFDVTSVAKPGAANRIAIRVERRTASGGAQRNPWWSATNVGWDWGTPVNTLGLWKDVQLVATGPARIDWVRVQTQLEEDHTRAKVTVSLDIDSAEAQRGKARFVIEGQGQKAEVVVDAALTKGRNMVAGELSLEKPALWWPNGQGGQPLYTVRSEIVGADGKTMDSRDTRFGVRDVRWVHTKDVPEQSLMRFQLVINGRKIRTMGSNLIPADLYFGRMVPKAKFLFQQAKAAGMNTLRVWGGGVILHEDLYDLADELGLVIMQGFPLANHVPPTDDAYLAMVDETARNIVRQVRNHPSVLEWDGGNEMPKEWKARTHPAFLLLQKIVAEEDGRMFRASCPDQEPNVLPPSGSFHGPWGMDRRWYPALNEANADAVMQGKPAVARQSMRQGEFGSHSPAELEVWQREFPVADQWPISIDNKVLHRKRTVRAIGPYSWINKNTIEDTFGPTDSLPELIEAGGFFGGDGLRYMLDCLRRGGGRIGGMTNWVLNEPWPNGAGSCLVDHDGRPKMMYDFYKQALAPVSLSLKYDLPFYSVEEGFKTELFLMSDAPERVEGLHWRLVARDRRGAVFAEKDGTAGISPLEVTSLGTMQLQLPEKTAFGPMFVELRLEDAAGKPLNERFYIFGCNDLYTPLARVLKSGAPDPDDDRGQLTARFERSSTRQNLVLSMPTKALHAQQMGAPWGFEKANIANGYYGADQGWNDAWFEVEVRQPNPRQPTKVGVFRFGRDRTGVVQDRCIDYMQIETSLDGDQWQKVFEQSGLTKLPGFSPAKTVEIRIAPVEAKFLRVRVVPPGEDEKAPYPGLDEFEVYAADEATAGSQLPSVKVLDRPELWRPMRKTTLEVSAAPVRVEGEQEVLELTVKNTGPMTAFPVEPHPLISYRTDLIVDNNHCFVPPGESRTITIRAAKQSSCGLSLAQTGWWISSWNAEKLTVPPTADVLLAVGRRDRMCREFLGYFEPAKAVKAAGAEAIVTSVDPGQVAYLMEAGKSVRFEFPVTAEAAGKPVTVRLHTSDQSKEIAAAVAISLNGRSVENTLPTGLGMQKENPQQLAYAASLEFSLPAGSLKAGTNTLDVKLANDGWFTWDSLEILSAR